MSGRIAIQHLPKAENSGILHLFNPVFTEDLTMEARFVETAGCIRIKMHKRTHTVWKKGFRGFHFDEVIFRNPFFAVLTSIKEELFF